MQTPHSAPQTACHVGHQAAANRHALSVGRRMAGDGPGGSGEGHTLPLGVLGGHLEMQLLLFWEVLEHEALERHRGMRFRS